MTKTMTVKFYARDPKDDKTKLAFTRYCNHLVSDRLDRFAVTNLQKHKDAYNFVRVDFCRDGRVLYTKDVKGF